MCLSVLMYLSVLPGRDEADFQLDLSLMVLVDLKPDQNFAEFVQLLVVVKEKDWTETGTHIEDIQVVVNQVLDDLHLVLSFPVSLEQTGSKQQRQVLGAHLVQTSTLLDPERRIQQELLL